MSSVFVGQITLTFVHQFNVIVNRWYNSSDVRPINKEVETRTDATISCVVTGITEQLNTIVWRKEGTDVTTLSGSNYVVSVGIYGSNSQTTTLTVKAAANTADTTYTCAITSNEWLLANRDTTVSLDVFCKSYNSPIQIINYT